VVEFQGQKWDLALRFERHYKPYSVYLSDVSKKDYIGTSTPRDYRSVVTITEENGTTFERDIWMNNPLRYAGETFYQSNYTPANPRTGKGEKTTLQVVRNTGWMVPYVSCMIVGTGLLAHFWLVLIRFLQRRGVTRTLKVGLLAYFGGMIGLSYAMREESEETLPDDEDHEPKGSPLAAKFKPAKPAADLSEPEIPESRNAYIVSWVLAVLVAGWLLRHAMPPRTQEGKADLVAFGELPLVYEGRTKPFDTLARNSLRVLSNRTTFLTEVKVKDDNGKVVMKDGKPKIKEVRNPAILWLLDLMSDPEVASRHRVFRIDSPHVQKTLKLERRKGFMYSLEEFYEPVIDGTLAKQADAARKKDDGKRSADDRKLLELERKLGLYSLLMNSFNPPGLPPVPKNQKDMMALQEFFMSLQQARRQLDTFDERQPPLSVPPIEQDEDDEEAAMPTNKWQTYARGVFTAFVQRQVQGQEPSEPVVLFMEILAAHGDKDAGTFNEKIKQYKSWLNKNTPEDVSVEMAGFESYFNHFSPAYYSAFSYLFAFIFACGALLGWSKTLNRAALLTIIATFFVHTFALWARMEISGRPPVTNLYSSAVFIGWGGVLLGIAFEAIYRNGIGNVIASALGAVTLGIAYLLSGDGDTFKVLQAVLDTQFWLATHVVCITLGYSTTFIAGTLGQFYVLTGFSSRKLTPTMSKDLSRMIYGTVCFGIFFSFVGTVLGGLWADDSWGRFWGWDPKENGALLIVIWNVLVLHARWDGMVKERGLAVLAIVGNIITSWSWFGVNELGVGLHSYGFTSGVWTTLWIFWISQIAVIIVGILPRGFWTSFRAWDRDKEIASQSVSETA
ncbi:MAG: cytochrome c biogenesis protein CcsA, partial [Planctomycetes bacterium]|nr:cytochrome c biogenesis protein CcsA [Planctomycetota bacterium]